MVALIPVLLLRLRGEQILGVGTTEGLDVESLERNALGGCTLGDLSPEERTQLWDPAARQRASMLLRLLQRLGVRNPTALNPCWEDPPYRAEPVMGLPALASSTALPALGGLYSF